MNNLIAQIKTVLGVDNPEPKSKTKDTEKKGIVIDIEQQTKDNVYFRRVLYTAEHMQLVFMSLKPGEDIGMESHDVDQFFRIEQGTGQVTINGTKAGVKDGSAIIVPAGAEHNVLNTGDEDLKIYTIYAKPHHQDGTIRGTKEDAEDPKNKEEFDGKITE